MFWHWQGPGLEHETFCFLVCFVLDLCFIVSSSCFAKFPNGYYKFIFSVFPFYFILKERNIENEKALKRNKEVSLGFFV